MILSILKTVSLWGAMISVVFAAHLGQNPFSNDRDYLYQSMLSHEKPSIQLQYDDISYIACGKPFPFQYDSLEIPGNTTVTETFYFNVLKEGEKIGSIRVHDSLYHHLTIGTLKYDYPESVMLSFLKNTVNELYLGVGNHDFFPNVIFHWDVLYNEKNPLCQLFEKLGFQTLNPPESCEPVHYSISLENLKKRLLQQEFTNTSLKNYEANIPKIHYQPKNDLIIDTKNCPRYGIEATKILLGILVNKRSFFPYSTVRWEDSGTLAAHSMKEIVFKKLGFQTSGKHWSLPLESLIGKNLEIEILPHPREKLYKKISMFGIALLIFYLMKSFLPELSLTIK